MEIESKAELEVCARVCVCACVRACVCASVCPNTGEGWGRSTSNQLALHWLFTGGGGGQIWYIRCTSARRK